MNPLTFFRLPGDEHFVDAGRVQCPLRRRDVDFDACAACGWAIGIDLDAKPPVVHCRPAPLPDWLRVPFT
jgi:hypothetical protein